MRKSNMTAAIATGPPAPKTPLAKLHSKMRDMSNMVEAVNGYGPQPALDQVQMPPEMQNAAKALHSHLDKAMTSAKKNLFKPNANIPPMPKGKKGR